jgi:NADPH-dependent 2,4-dienoyl-CoA reductase/sulfur reductase-like enzyme
MESGDVVVIGAGPAGVEAAMAAQSCGLDVLIIDEAHEAGGQIYRAGPAFNIPEGKLLRDRLQKSGVPAAFEHRIWSAAKTTTGFELAAVGPTSSRVVAASAIIVASGAIERFYPRVGWTLPGVIGLGAATIMMKAQGILPGRRVLVCGPGPLATLVAHLIQDHGGEVVALADPNPRRAWLRALPAMASRPDLFIDGAKWITQLLAKRVPIFQGWDIVSISGRNSVESVTLSQQDGSRKRVFEADAVCFGHGLVPATEFFRLLGAPMEYRPERGGWIPRLDLHQRAGIARLYAAGDCAQILGVAAAPLTGRLAGLTAAFDLQRISQTEYRRSYTHARSSLSRISYFGHEIARMMQPRASAMEHVPDETIVCRCEDVTVGELRTAVRQGAREINALKAATRCGMGPCGGRSCGEAAGAVMECAGVPRASIGYWTARPPLRPVPIESLIGNFSYDDIPITEPAPL